MPVQPSREEISILKVKNFLSAAKEINGNPKIIEDYIKHRMSDSEIADIELEWGLLGTELKSIIEPATGHFKSVFMMLVQEYRAAKRNPSIIDEDKILTLEEVGRYFPDGKGRPKTKRAIQYWIEDGLINAVSYPGGIGQGIWKSEVLRLLKQDNRGKDIDILPSY